MKKFLYISCFIAMFSLSCVKKHGCTYPGAANPDPIATEDDGSCYNEINAYFMILDINEQQFLDSNHLFLRVYLDGELHIEDSLAAFVFPDKSVNSCHQRSTYHLKTSAPGKNFDLLIVNQDSSVVMEDFITLDAGCDEVEIYM